MSAAADVLALLDVRPATLGTGQLVCVDGPSGSGKTTLAERLLDLSVLGEAAVVRLDDLYDGWHGLSTVESQLAGLLEPLAAGAPGHYRRYDWHAGRFAGTVTVDPVPLLVLEGVGSGSARFAELVTVLVWVEAPLDVRRRRGLARDGDSFAPHWESWAKAERDHFAAQRTRERADLIVDGTRGLA